MVNEKAVNIFGDVSRNYVREKRENINIHRVETVSKYLDDMRPKMSADNKRIILENFLVVRKGKVQKGLLKIPQTSTLIHGESRIGKTYLIKTLMEFLKDRQRQCHRIMKSVAGNYYYSDHGRMKRNRLAVNTLHAHSFMYLTENDFRNLAVKKNETEIYKILDRISDKNLKYIFIDELFYRSNWNFSGYNAGAESYFKQLWDFLVEAKFHKTSPKIIIGTTNNRPGKKQSFIPAPIQGRISDIFGNVLDFF